MCNTRIVVDADLSAPIDSRGQTAYGHRLADGSWSSGLIAELLEGRADAALAWMGSLELTRRHARDVLPYYDEAGTALLLSRKPTNPFIRDELIPCLKALGLAPRQHNFL